MKKNIFICIFQVLFIFIIVSCNEGELREGDYCSDSDTQTACQDSKLYICENYEYKSSSCESVCEKSGLKFSGECRHDSEIDRDVCWCESSNTVCQENSISCMSDTEVKICAGDKWHEFVCSDRKCQEAGYSSFAGDCSYSSEKGHDVCWCYQ